MAIGGGPGRLRSVPRLHLMKDTIRIKSKAIYMQQRNTPVALTAAQTALYSADVVKRYLAGTKKKALCVPGVAFVWMKLLLQQISSV